MKTTRCIFVLFLSCLLFAYAQSDSETEPAVEELHETLVVTATKQERKLKEVPASISVINAQTIQEKGATSAGEELQGIPGIFLRRQEEGANFMQLNIRGVTGVHGNDTFLALLDGIPFVTAHEEVLLAEIPFGAVTRTEVVRGPVSALYGRGSISGAINYITKSPERDRDFSLDLVGGSDGYAKPHFSASLPIRDDAHHLLIDAYVERFDGWRTNTSGETGNLLLKDVLRFNHGGSLTSYLNYHQNAHEPGGVLPLDAEGNVIPNAAGRRGFLGYEPVEYDRDSLMLAFRYEQPLGNQLSLEATAHYRQTEDNNQLNFFDPFGFDPENNILRVNGFENDRKTDVFFIEPRLTWHSDNHQITAGMNLEWVDLKETDWWTGQNGFNFDTFDFYFYEINIDYATGEVLNRDNPFWVSRNETYRGDSSNQFRAVYFQDEWQIGTGTTLTLGARYDEFERDAQIDSDVDFDGVIDQNPELSDKESHVSPKFALFHQFNPQFGAYVSYGEGFNSNFGAVWQWDPGLYQRGTEVKPSVSRNGELGFKGQISGRFAINATLYQLTQDDRLVFVSNPQGFGPPIASTADEFRSRGIELDAQIEIAEGWRAGFQYTYTDAEWQEYNVGGEDLSGKRPRGVPEQLFSAQLHADLSANLRAWGAFYHHDDYAVTLDNRVIDGGFNLVDLGAQYQLPKLGAKLTIVGKNVFNERYYSLFGAQTPQTAHPGRPAHFLMTLGFDF